MLAGGGRPKVADVVVGPAAVGTNQWSTPVLSGCPERSFAARRGILLLWVHRRQQEVEVAVLCSWDQLEGTGDLLVAW